jgi:Ca-activated chloride channel family protein
VSLSFERPLLILPGVLAVILIPVLSRFFRHILTLPVPLGPPGGIPFKPPLGVEFLRKFLFIPELLGIFLLFIAAAGPLLISREMVLLNRGADILFVLDVSPSMAGLDMDGRSRFDVARELVIDFAEKRPADALGLVAVGNEASLLLPPTVDRDLLLSRLDELGIGELGDGTALGLGLAIAALHIRNSAAPRRVVVLITDGENNAGAVHPETAAAVLREEGASLWVIGVGSSGEVPIDYVDPRTRIRRTGAFDSRFDPESLRLIAGTAGGTYLAAPSFNSFYEAFHRVSREEMIISRSGTVARTKKIGSPCIIAALCLLCLTRFIRHWIPGALL